MKSTPHKVSSQVPPNPHIDYHEPAPERGGTIPLAAKRAQDKLAAGASSPTAQKALARFADLYINWTAATVRAHQLVLSRISVGAARLTTEQAAEQVRANFALARDSVANSGHVVSIAPGRAGAHGYWVVVTEEHTQGKGAYEGLPSQLRVTYAHVQHVSAGWVVSTWEPQN